MSWNESKRSNVVFNRNERSPCNCGWEVRFGYGVAVTLAIFEAKRFFMLILEIFAEWQIIRFAGGLQPVVFTLVNVSVGLPTALITVRSIRDRKVPRCCAETRRSLKCLLIAIAICAILNAATLVSIGYHISVRQESLIDIFNNSMRLYVSTASYKYAIDEIQFIFQCCGHTSYADWFQFDWQGVDYASREEMAAQSRISDEEYRDRGVPFSCCDLRAMLPCEHTEIQGNDVKTINTNGCAQVMSPVLLRIVIVAYVMTSTSYADCCAERVACISPRRPSRTTRAAYRWTAQGNRAVFPQTNPFGTRRSTRTVPHKSWRQLQLKSRYKRKKRSRIIGVGSPSSPDRRRFSLRRLASRTLETKTKKKNKHSGRRAIDRRPLF
ncbi:uncharacterized protein LOC117221206 isoform X2 [Megalopta genalis]|uniref:uncharacterized protein LOC117221206 isoform X2 n=1 Tax=Megalopta genalis TaxID=115081 RepID=UPI003FD32297